MNASQPHTVVNKTPIYVRRNYEHLRSSSILYTNAKMSAEWAYIKQIHVYTRKRYELENILQSHEAQAKIKKIDKATRDSTISWC